MHVEAPIGFVNILFLLFFLRYLISFKQKLYLNKIRVYNRNCRRLGISQLSKKKQIIINIRKESEEICG